VNTQPLSYNYSEHTAIII